jgi:hypothetical protein
MIVHVDEWRRATERERVCVCVGGQAGMARRWVMRVGLGCELVWSGVLGAIVPAPPLLASLHPPSIIHGYFWLLTRYLPR